MQIREEILRKIEVIFNTELGNDSIEITYESSTNNVDSWDSMNNLILISAIEKEFNMSFPLDIIFDAKNVGDLCDYILSQSNVA